MDPHGCTTCRAHSSAFGGVHNFFVKMVSGRHFNNAGGRLRKLNISPRAPSCCTISAESINAYNTFIVKPTTPNRACVLADCLSSFVFCGCARARSVRVPRVPCSRNTLVFLWPTTYCQCTRSVAHLPSGPGLGELAPLSAQDLAFLLSNLSEMRS